MSTAFFWIFIALLALGTPVVFALLIGPITAAAAVTAAAKLRL